MSEELKHSEDEYSVEALQTGWVIDELDNLPRGSDLAIAQRTSSGQDRLFETFDPDASCPLDVGKIDTTYNDFIRTQRQYNGI